MKTQAWWREPTRGQWISFLAAWLGWVMDAFDFTIFLLVMPDIRGLPYNNTGNFSSGFLPVAHAGTVIKPTAKISVDKTEINPGDDVKVSWSTQGADVVTVGGYGPVSASGSMTVKPSETTSYTLTASNSLGVEISTVTVTVVPKKLPPPRSASGRGEGGDFPRPSHRER